MSGATTTSKPTSPTPVLDNQGGNGQSNGQGGAQGGQSGNNDNNGGGNTVNNGNHYYYIGNSLQFYFISPVENIVLLLSVLISTIQN